MSSILAGALVLVPTTAQATHVSCGDTITSDTTLDSDLLDCPGTALAIGADGVTLDLGGHLVDGTPLSGAGIQILFGRDNITIRNGVVQQFSQGVAIRASTGNLLSDLELRNNRGWGALLAGGSHFNTLERLFAHDNRFDGISLGEEEFNSSDANDNRVEDSRFEQNGGDGIAINNSERNVLFRNVVTGNGRQGIGLSDCCVDADGNAVIDNRLFGNGTLSGFAEVGLALEDGDTIEGNVIGGTVSLRDSPRATIAYNQLEGIFANSTDQPGELQIRNNSVEQHGIRLTRTHDSSVTGNRIHSTSDGISIDSSDRMSVADNTIRGGLFGIVSGSNSARYEHNRISRTALDGMQLFGSDVVVLNNRVMRSDQDGIQIVALPAVVGGNTSNHNRGWGIVASTGTTDTGRNKAHGNGVPAQCLNVRCK